MAGTGILHHVGTFLLFAATILLLVTTISAPVVNNLGLLTVNLGNATSEHGSYMQFGTFGYCTIHTADNDASYCSNRMIGYSPSDVMNSVEGTNFGTASADTSSALTRVMILHPIACGVAFIAFLLSLGAGFIGSLLAAVVSLVAFIITIVVMATDFSLFALVRDKVNSDGSNSHAYFSAAIWTILAAAICLLLGALIVFLSCCSARMHKKRNRDVPKNDYGYAQDTRRRWYQRGPLGRRSRV